MVRRNRCKHFKKRFGRKLLLVTGMLVWLLLIVYGWLARTTSILAKRKLLLVTGMLVWMLLVMYGWLVAHYRNNTNRESHRNDPGESLVTRGHRILTLSTSVTRGSYRTSTANRSLQSLTDMATHIRFLKVHKAGSTTIQNMLFRFGIRHDLNILLPMQGNFLCDNNEAVLPLPPKAHFDIFACHSTYSKQFYAKILPKDSVNIGIIREPEDRMISAAYYYRDVFTKSYLMEVSTQNYIHDLIQHPELYEKDAFSYTKNSMGKDFGFSSKLLPNDTQEINSYLRFLDKDFFLVMIMERFEESLVLLRRLLRWSMVDILFLRVNSHGYKNVHLTDGERAKLRNTCFLDYAIYEYFLKRFEDRVQKEGADFADEVVQFGITLESVKIFCNSNTNKSLNVDASKWNEPFAVSRYDCSLMKKREPSFIEHIKDRHRRRYPNERYPYSKTSENRTHKIKKV